MRHGQKAKVESRRSGAGGVGGCGRSVCARSTGKHCKRWLNCLEHERKKNSKSVLAWRDAEAWLAEEASWYCYDVQHEIEEDAAVWTGEVDWSLHGFYNPGEIQDSVDDMPSNSSWSFESSDVESEEESGDGDKVITAVSTTCSDLDATSVLDASGSKEQTGTAAAEGWKAAMAMAEESARRWWSRYCAGELSAHGELKPRRRKRVDRQIQAPNWEEFQQRFLRKHLHRLTQDLESVWSERVDFKPAPLNNALRLQFLQDMGTSEATVVPVFHGTKIENYDSIYDRGLLVPGEGNEIKVANGSAHGRGIYTARVGNARTSRGYCQSQKRMLVCAVLDHDVTFHGNLELDTPVKHVGDSVLVVQDPRRVVPVFEAVGTGVRCETPPPPPVLASNSAARVAPPPRPSSGSNTLAACSKVRLSQATSWRTRAGGRQVPVNVKVVRTARCCQHADHHRTIVPLEPLQQRVEGRLAVFLTRRGAMKRRPRQAFM